MTPDKAIELMELLIKDLPQSPRDKVEADTITAEKMSLGALKLVRAIRRLERNPGAIYDNLPGEVKEHAGVK
jgi:hypothetical protein